MANTEIQIRDHISKVIQNDYKNLNSGEEGIEKMKTQSWTTKQP